MQGCVVFFVQKWVEVNLAGSMFFDRQGRQLHNPDSTVLGQNKNRPLAKLGKAVNIADASNQRKAKSETASAVAVAFREDTKPFDKADSVFHKDTLL